MSSSSARWLTTDTVKVKYGVTLDQSYLDPYARFYIRNQLDPANGMTRLWFKEDVEFYAPKIREQQLERTTEEIATRVSRAAQEERDKLDRFRKERDQK